MAALEECIRVLLACPVFLETGKMNTSGVSLAITGGFVLLWVLIMVPLSMGILSFFFCVASGNQTPLSQAFDFFRPRLYGKSLALFLQLFWRLFFYAIPLLGPGGSLLLLPRIWRAVAQYNVALTWTGGILVVIGGCVWSMLALRYFLAPFFLSDNESIKIQQAIRLSIKWMKGEKMRTAGLVLSYTGWLLACVFVIPIFYALPYLLTGLSVRAHVLLALHDTAPPQGVHLAKTDNAKRSARSRRRHASA